MDFEKIAAEFADGLSAGPIPETAAEKVERALKRVLLSVPGPENLHREKIMKRLEIGRAMYYRLLSGVDKNLV